MNEATDFLPRVQWKLIYFADINDCESNPCGRLEACRNAHGPGYACEGRDNNTALSAMYAACNSKYRRTFTA